MKTQHDSQAVSPVVGVILMVAVTVILSAVIGTFVFNLGQGLSDGDTSNAAIEASTNANGTATVQLIDAGNADTIIVRNSSGGEKTLTDAGNSVTIGTRADPVTILAERDGSTTVVQTYDPRRVGGIDNFEDGILGSEYSGDTGMFTVQSTTAFAGSSALEGTGTPSGITILSSTSGLPRYPQAGDTFQAWVRPQGSTTQAGYYFGFQDANNHYRVHLDAEFGELELIKVSGGSGGELDMQGSISYATGSWYRIVTEWGTDGAITATLYDSSGTKLAEVSATDTTWSEGGFGWNHKNDGAYFDAANITATAG